MRRAGLEASTTSVAASATHTKAMLRAAETQPTHTMVPMRRSTGLTRASMRSTGPSGHAGVRNTVSMLASESALRRRNPSRSRGGS